MMGSQKNNIDQQSLGASLQDLINNDFDFSLQTSLESTPAPRPSDTLLPDTLDSYNDGWLFSPRGCSSAGSSIYGFQHGEVFGSAAQAYKHTRSSLPLTTEPPPPSQLPQPSIFDIPTNSMDNGFDITTASASSTLPGYPNIQQSLTATQTPPKIGGRFTRDSIRILRAWLLAHTDNPYLSDVDRKLLQEQTGLTRTQVTNWLANARRRTNFLPSRTQSPQESPGPRDIPRRAGTPAPRDLASAMNPLERWVESPPENEPASVTAIARAVSSAQFHNGERRERSEPLLDTPPARSIDTSHSSNGSLSSANSYASQTSLGSFEAFKTPRSRRRRKAYRRAEGKTSLATLLKTFQCTFCTESFKKKYDWQRHENTVHLPLERWICSPQGPRAQNPQDGEVSCLFCALPNPDDAHIESHNYSACRDRSIEERTFNRKDHLRQHLKLVHDTKYSDWPMGSWRIPIPDIASRCGFCGLVMDTWDTRVSHLSDHFKLGKTMADWQGDWGFEPSILAMVENSIPPYLIEFERHTPYPFQGGRALVATPRSAYELLKLELAYFMQRYFDKNSRMPTIEDMQLEACRIILVSETMARRDSPQLASWLRDLILGNPQILQRAKLGPIRSPVESRLYPSRINGKNNLFEDCPFEAQLLESVQAKIALGLASQVSDSELKQEACSIIGRIEEVSTTPSDFIATWFVRLIHSSTDWLSPFCQRAGVSRVQIPAHGEANNKVSIYDYNRLEHEMRQYVDNQRLLGLEPSDTELRCQARIIIGEAADGWTQTAADNQDWLSSFKRRHQATFLEPDTQPSQPDLEMPFLDASQTVTGDLVSIGVMPWSNDKESLLSARALVMGTSHFTLNDSNFHRWMEDELQRWAVATMSPHNPTRHVPTDAEIQHYARMMAYNDDDPVNQTIADNPYWLGGFKKSLNIS